MPLNYRDHNILWCFFRRAIHTSGRIPKNPFDSTAYTFQGEAAHLHGKWVGPPIRRCWISLPSLGHLFLLSNEDSRNLAAVAFGLDFKSCLQSSEMNTASSSKLVPAKLNCLHTEYCFVQILGLGFLGSLEGFTFWKIFVKCNRCSSLSIPLLCHGIKSFFSFLKLISCGLFWGNFTFFNHQAYPGLSR